MICLFSEQPTAALRLMAGRFTISLENVRFEPQKNDTVREKKGYRRCDIYGSWQLENRRRWLWGRIGGDVVATLKRRGADCGGVRVEKEWENDRELGARRMGVAVVVSGGEVRFSDMWRWRNEREEREGKDSCLFFLH